MSGCARMDYRVTADGRVYLLEANSNPNLAADEDLARSAASAGIDYGDLLQRIVNLGMAYQAEWRHYE
jgi:D-alanine-D-alanine ligase